MPHDTTHHPTSPSAALRRRPLPIIQLALLLALCTAALAPAANAAPRTPSIDRKHVCDWTFVAGPRRGQTGKESRRWLGSLPTLQESTWWPGRTGDSSDTFTSPTTVPGATETTRWNVTARFNNNQASGKVDVSAAVYRYAQSQRVIYHGFSNGAYVSCLELSPGALDWIHNTYQTTGGQADVCNCGNGYHYDATIACLERCTAHWNDDALWPRLAPRCLEGDSIVAKVACLLSRDPTAGGPQGPIHDDPGSCVIHPSMPGCNGAGGGQGASCGAGNQPYCRPECVCQANNVCRCPPEPEP